MRRSENEVSPTVSAADVKCVTCDRRCAESETRFTVYAPRGKVEKDLEQVVTKAGFEVVQRMNLANLARERLAVEAPPLDLLYMNHPLLLLQTFFMGGEPALLFPFLAILRPSGDSTEVCITSAWSQGNGPRTVLTEHLAVHTRGRLLDAVSALRETK